MLLDVWYRHAGDHDCNAGGVRRLRVHVEEGRLDERGLLGVIRMAVEINTCMAQNLGLQSSSSCNFESVIKTRTAIT